MRRDKMREWLRRMVAEQRQWIEEHGGSLAGYIAFYSDRYGRSEDEAVAIYNADLANLRQFEGRVAR